MQNADVSAELLRLESIIRAGVDPSIIGLRIKPVEVDGGSIILIHILKSFNPPHRADYKRINKRFYVRNSSGVHEPSIEELRLLFSNQRNIRERADAFIGERFLRIQANDGIIPISVSDGALIMHLVPLPNFGTKTQKEIPENLHEQIKYIMLIWTSGYNVQVNLEGYYCFSVTTQVPQRRSSRIEH